MLLKSTIMTEGSKPLLRDIDAGGGESGSGQNQRTKSSSPTTR